MTQITKRISYLTTVLAIVLLLAVLATLVVRADNENGTVNLSGGTTLINNTTYPICYLSVVPSNSWFPKLIDLGDDDQLDAWESIVVPLEPSSNNIYRIEAVDCSTSATKVVDSIRRFQYGGRYNLQVVEGVATVKNTSMTNICSLSVRPRSQSGYGNEWSVYLGQDGQLTPNETVNMYLTTTDTMYDVRAESCNPTITMVQKNRVIVVTGDRYNVEWGEFDLNNQSSQAPSIAGQPCPTNGVWPKGCIPS